MSTVDTLRRRLPAVARVRRRAGGAASVAGLAVLLGSGTWLVAVLLPSLGAIVAAALGLGAGTAAGLDALLVLALAAALALGGAAADGPTGDAAGAVGALLAGLGGVLAAALPGAVTTAVAAIASVAGFGLLAPGTVRHCRVHRRPGTAGAALGVVAAAHLPANGLLGVFPRPLAYVVFGSWRAAVLVAAAVLLAGGGAWLRATGTTPIGALRSLARPGLRTRRGERAAAGNRPAVRRPVLVAGVALGCVAWALVAAVAVHGRVTAAIQSPIPGLVARLLAVPMVLGALAAGPGLDRAGPRYAGVLGLLGAAAGTVGLVATSGTVPLAVGVLLLGTATGALLTVVLAVPVHLAAAGPSSHGAASGLGLAVALVAAALARAVVGAAGPVSVATVLGVFPAVLGAGALWWLRPRHLGTGPPDSTGGEGS